MTPRWAASCCSCSIYRSRPPGTLPLGAVPNVIEYVRFNGPAFKWLALLVSPRAAAAIAVLAGLGVAAWMRRRYSADEPASWAWPMAVALVAAPVVYPWYLLYFTPFLFTRRALPLTVWTLSILPVYVVWELAYRYGHRWRVPVGVMWIEYGIVVVAVLVVARMPPRLSHGVESTAATELR